MKLQIGVKVLIKNSRGEYLFLRRSSPLMTDTSDSSWDIPGGRINAEENLIDALRREIQEEIGHDMVSAPDLIAAQDIFVPDKDLHVVRLTHVISEDVPEIRLSDEHTAYKWVSQENILAVESEPYLAEVIASIGGQQIGTE